jgi:hypothetical protein
VAATRKPRATGIPRTVFWEDLHRCPDVESALGNRFFKETEEDLFRQSRISEGVAPVENRW